MIFKVVIIDDEPIIVEGLKRSIKWEEKQCQVVGTAFSGEDGLELILREKPDIIISDICMSGMDGLSMLAGIKSQMPNVQIAILTGYRDFDYAQRAISVGAKRFLLKPSKMDEILEAVDAMTERLRALDEMKTGLDFKQEESMIESEGENVASSFVVKNAVKYVEEHYKEKLKLSDVADNVFVSQWHLSKLLNRHLDQNFSELLNGIRIEKAKELLKDPALRVGDIAEEVGFLDIAHFSRVFKKIVGVSANDFRNTL